MKSRLVCGPALPRWVRDLCELPVLCVACRRGDDVAPMVDLAARRLKVEFNCRLGLILLDGLQSIYRPSDEEDEAFAWAAVQDLRRQAEEHEAAVLLVHHTGKRADGPRGSQAWADAANFILQIDAEQDRKTGFFRKRRLRLTKTRHGPPLDLGVFRIEASPAGAVLRDRSEVSKSVEPTGAQERPSKSRESKRSTSPPNGFGRLSRPHRGAARRSRRTGQRPSRSTWPWRSTMATSPRRATPGTFGATC